MVYRNTQVPIGYVKREGMYIQPCSYHQEGSSDDWIGIFRFLVWDYWALDGFRISKEALVMVGGLRHGVDGVVRCLG